MRRVWLVLAREYLENVKTKAFLIAVLMTPLLAGLMFLVPQWAQRQAVPQRRLALADLTGVLGAEFSAGLVEKRDPSAGPEAPSLYSVEELALSGDETARGAQLASMRGALDQRVKDGEIFGYVVIHPSALSAASTKAPSEMVVGNIADVEATEHVRSALQRARNAHVVREHRVSEEAAKLLSAAPALRPRSVLAKAGEDPGTRLFAPIVMMLVLFLTIVGTSQALITSTLEEKSNRVVEVLLSSVSPFQLMAGKVLGVCAVGLTLMAIWGTAGGGALAAQGLTSLVAGPTLALALVYYVLGFLLIASLMVAVGSACNTLKEAQNLLSPLMVVLTMPILLLIVVLKDPHGTASTALSFFPLFTPFLMMMRIGSVPPPPVEQILGSIALLAVSTAIAIWLASRVFRVGILLYGKPPSIREIVRWMRSGA